jgi:hypothetical protein
MATAAERATDSATADRYATTTSKGAGAPRAHAEASVLTTPGRGGADAVPPATAVLIQVNASVPSRLPYASQQHSPTWNVAGPRG